MSDKMSVSCRAPSHSLTLNSTFDCCNTMPGITVITRISPLEFFQLTKWFRSYRSYGLDRRGFKSDNCEFHLLVFVVCHHFHKISKLYLPDSAGAITSRAAIKILQKTPTEQTQSKGPVQGLQLAEAKSSRQLAAKSL